MHIHPTPVKIKIGIFTAINEAVKAWESRHDKPVPYHVYLMAIDAGVSEAVRQHNQENSNAS